MTRLRPTLGLGLAVWLGWLSAGGLPGQEVGEDPFGAAPAAPAAAAGEDPFGSAPATPSAAADEDPFGAAPAGAAPAATPAAGARKPAEAAKAQAAPAETDSIVLGVRDMHPIRPRELMWAARTVLQAGRPDEARRYLKLLLDAKPDAATWVALQARYGSGLFFRLLRDETLQPEGQEVAVAALEAATQTSRDPARLDALIAQLGDADDVQRHQALVDLRQAGVSAATAMIAVLSDPQRRGLHGAVVDALATLGSIAEGPLMSALEAGDPYVRRQVIRALGLQESRAAIPWLLKPSLDPGNPAELRQAAGEALVRIVGAKPELPEAQKFLSRQVNEYLAGKSASPPDSDGMVPIWTWDETRRTGTMQMLATGIASRWIAARLAQDLYSLTPQSAEAQQLRLLTLLEFAGATDSLERPLLNGEKDARDAVAAEGARAVEGALASAIERDLVPAAVAALEVLRDIGDARLLVGGGGHPATVAQALQHADPRVRFAAAAAILNWNPGTSYPGSSYLVDTLAYFVKTAGTRRALVGHPRTDLGRSLAGMLQELGFAADMASTGRETLRLAMSSPDYELIMLSDGIDLPPVKELVQQMRREPSTAALPVGILTREEQLQEMQRFAETDPLTAAFPRAHDVSGLTLHVRRLLELLDRKTVTADDRLAWAEAALDYFARVAADQRHYLFPEVLGEQPTLIQSLSVPALTVKAAHVLGRIGSPEAQRALTQLASQRDRTVQQRQAAAAAFAVAVEQRGLLLSRREILDQYELYNRSGGFEQESQQILGAILDSIEAPSKVKP